MVVVDRIEGGGKPRHQRGYVGAIGRLYLRLHLAWRSLVGIAMACFGWKYVCKAMIVVHHHGVEFALRSDVDSSQPPTPPRNEVTVALSAGGRAKVNSGRRSVMFVVRLVDLPCRQPYISRLFCESHVGRCIRPDKVPSGPGPNGTLLMSRIPMGRR